MATLGGEMLYILEQRLQAQNIAQDKCNKVLQDVISSMFNSKFIEELFKPQDIYSSLSVRQIFDRLAHSSIMRLNESSMDKLYDLMTMGFKYQIMSCPQASDILQISLNHIDLIGIVCANSDCAALIDFTRKQLLDTYTSLSTLTWERVRQTLLNFLQDRKVRVSLFLQDNLQSQDGYINISHMGTLPYITVPPGEVRLYTNGTLKRSLTISLPNCIGVIVNSQHIPTLLGLNLYSKQRSKVESFAPPPTTSPKHNDFGGINSPSNFSRNKQALIPPEKATSEKIANVAKSELALLANLIQIPKTDTDNFTLQLFPESGPTNSAVGDSRSDVIIFEGFDKAGRAKEISSRLKSFGFDDDSAAIKSYNITEDDDLLDLLDSTN